MSMHQYIGARYVPKFYQNSLDPTSTEWEANVTYENMVWVSTQNGHMYLSKKTVPANIGTPAQNPEYWMEAGQFNGYIQSLQYQIDDMNDGSVSGSLQNQIDEMNDGSVSGSLQNQIDEIDDFVDHTDLSRRKFWYVGDSFLEMVDGWGDYLDPILDKTATRTCDGGIGFVNVGNNSGVNLPALVTAATVPDGITDVVLIAGCNDCKAANVSALDGNITNTISNIKSKAPGCKIWVAFNGFYMKDAYSDYANRIAYIGYVYNKIESNCLAHNNVVFMKSPYYGIFDKVYFQNDTNGVHPDVSGMRMIARCVYKHLIGGGDMVWERNHVMYNGVMAIKTCNIDYVQVDVRIGTIYNATAINMPAGAFSLLYDDAGFPVVARENYELASSVYVELTDTSDVVTYDQAVLIIDPYDRLRILTPSAHNNIKKIAVKNTSTITAKLLNDYITTY